jgi:hypothetical protein
MVRYLKLDIFIGKLVSLTLETILSKACHPFDNEPTIIFDCNDNLTICVACTSSIQCFA